METIESKNSALLRDVPYPFKAMLAICSDLDETPGLDCYLETSKFLNSSVETRFGSGLALETGNTIYFHMDPDSFSYWNTNDIGREKIRTLIRSGHIDCIHSFGDTATSRAQVQACIDELVDHDCSIRVWVDHAVAPSNFSADIMQGYGDISDSDVYHADISTDYGIRYVCRGRVTSMIGQDRKPSFGGILSINRFFASVKTLLKEIAKYLLAGFGNDKYAMHKTNDLIRDISLRDGRDVKEFLRSNPHPDGVARGENAAGMATVLRNDVLDRLVRRGAKCILYTHLGKEIDPLTGFSAETLDALKALESKQSANEILVTTTRRLLEFSEMSESVSWTTVDTDNQLSITVEGVDECLSLQGLGFSVASNKAVVIMHGQQKLAVSNAPCPEYPGNSVWYVPWQKLEYPASV